MYSIVVIFNGLINDYFLVNLYKWILSNNFNRQNLMTFSLKINGQLKMSNLLLKLDVKRECKR